MEDSLEKAVVIGVTFIAVIFGIFMTAEYQPTYVKSTAIINNRGVSHSINSNMGNSDYYVKTSTKNARVRDEDFFKTPTRNKNLRDKIKLTTRKGIIIPVTKISATEYLYQK